MLKAGFAVADITPKVGSWLTGFIARNGPSTDIDLPLEVRALWLGSHQSSVVVVSMDIVGIDQPTADGIACEVATLTHWAANRVILHATHTHSGPRSLPIRGIGDAEPEYLAMLTRQIVKAAVAARAAAKPVRASWSSAPLKLGANRRVWSGGTTIMGQNPDAPADTKVRVLSLTGGPRPIMLMQHACHPYCISPAQTLISPDFCGYAVRELDAAGVDGLFINGCAGDITPLRSGGGQQAAAEEGRRLAQAAMSAAATRKNEPPIADDRLWCDSAQLMLDYDALPDRAELRKIFASFDQPLAADAPSVDRRVREAMLQWRTDLSAAIATGDVLSPQPIRVSLLRVADGALVTLPGEPFIATGMEIGTKLAATKPGVSEVAVAGYSHGFCGYLPTPDAYPLGGYEVDVAHLYLNLWRTSPQSPAKIVNAVMSLWEASNRNGTFNLETSR